MISLKELNPHNYPTNDEIDNNLEMLLERLNVIRAAWGSPMTITSGLRSQAQQEGLIVAGKSNAHKSKHLIGAAADILDQDGSLKRWVKDNEVLFEQVGLWVEDFAYTSGWIHFQIFAPMSGKRFFIP